MAIACKYEKSVIGRVNGFFQTFGILLRVANQERKTFLEILAIHANAL